jgi:hypothetical protein
MTTDSKSSALRAPLVALALALALVVTPFVGQRISVREAHAVVGRPLTPLSYSGVARRTTRRAVAVSPTVNPAFRW